jgi:hypothetical protein
MDFTVGAPLVGAPLVVALVWAMKYKIVDIIPLFSDEINC